MTDSKIADPAPTNEERIRNRCQRACFTVQACFPAADDACPMCRVADSYAELLAALKLYVDWFGAAHVNGCPADDTCFCSGSAVNDAVNTAIRNAEGPIPSPVAGAK